MPSARALAAGKAIIEMSLLGGDVEKQLKAIQAKGEAIGASFAKLGATMATVGASITGAFVGTLAVFSQVGSEIADMTGRTGASAKTLTELKFAAQQTGASMEDVGIAMKTMQKNGVDPNTFFDVARSIAAINDPVKQAQAAMEAWGARSGTKLLPMIGQLDMLREKANRLGLVWSDEMVSRADRFGDAIDTLKAQFVALASKVADHVAPILSDLLERVSDYTATLIACISEHGDAVLAFAGLGVALTAVGTATVATGSLIVAFTATVTASVTAFGALAAAVAFIASPLGIATLAVGALGAAVVAVTAYFIDWRDVIASVSTELQAMIGSLDAARKLGNAFQGIPWDAPSNPPSVPAAGASAKGKPMAADDDPMGLGRMVQHDKALEAIGVAKEWFKKKSDAAQAELANLLGAMTETPGIVRMNKKLAAHTSAGMDVARQRSTMSTGTFDTRLAKQIFGATSDNVEKQQLETQQKMLKELQQKRRAGIPVI